MTARSFYIQDSDVIDLYVIGYRGMGESIILNVANQMIGVVDCYKTSNYFLTKQILAEELKITELDFVCWTHTDEDHSRGLSELFPYVSEKTIFIMPDGISYKQIRSFLDEDDDSEYKQIFQLIREKVVEYNYVAANQYVSIRPLYRNMLLSESSKKYSLTVDAFAPVAMIAQENSLKSIRDIAENNKRLHEKPNLYSVGLKITVTSDDDPPITICLTGDIDNHTIKAIPPTELRLAFENNVIFKIPHHCSKNSDELIHSSYVRYFSHAVTTAYTRGRSSLPNQPLLDRYKKIGQVSRTDLDRDYEYGYVHYQIPISNYLGSDIKVNYEGAAGIA